MTDPQPATSAEPAPSLAEAVAAPTPMIKPIVRPAANKPPRVRVDIDDETEQEIAASLGEFKDEDFKRTPTRFSPPLIPRVGPGGPAGSAPSAGAAAGATPRGPKPARDNRRRGRVLSITGDNIFVDIGGKSQGIISAMQFEDEPLPAIGAEIDVIVDHYEAAEGLLVLRKPGAAQEADWSSIAEGMIVEGRVTASNKGGLEVDLSGIRAFMPASQIDLVRVEGLEQFVGQPMRCQVTEVKRSERNVLVSRRNLLEAEREVAREQTWTTLAEGQTRTGIVRSVKDFGAFIDLGGVDGLLPVREMSWAHVTDPNEIVRPGQQVQVKVLRIDRETRKLTLGLKQLQLGPWDTIEQNFPVGTFATGKVTKLMEFGAFVELAPGLEGLVHISELAPARVRRVSDIVQEGQEIAVRILRIDREARRIALSHKATIQKAEEAPPAEPEPDEPPAALKPPRKIPLKGGGGTTGSGLFGLPPSAPKS